MKRSEMIKLIDELLDIHHRHVEGYETIDDPAKLFLDKIEEAGMLPPVRGLTYDDLAAMRIVIPSNEQFRCYHTWEKE